MIGLGVWIMKKVERLSEEVYLKQTYDKANTEPCTVLRKY